MLAMESTIQKTALSRKAGRAHNPPHKAVMQITTAIALEAKKADM